MARRKFGTKIQISDNTINKMEDDIIEKDLENTERIINEDNKKLKAKAANFLKVVNEVQDKIQNIENLMLAQKKLRTQIRNNLGVTGRFLTQYETDEYRHNKEELSNELKGQEVDKLYQAAFAFHEEINEELGQEVITVIVLPDSNGEPILFKLTKEEIFDNKILSYEETSKSARLAARFKTNAEKMRQAGIQAINRDDLNIEDNLNLLNLNQTYKTVLYRYDTYNQIVMWLYPRKQWNWSKVSARGDIAEAYSMFFLKKAEYDFKSTNLEENIDYFMRLGVQEVDNVSGLLQGDISSGQYEYAIKSADASYMSIMQMIPLAESILTKPNFNLRDYKEKLKKRKQKMRNPIYNSLENTVSTSLQEVINDINRSS